MNDIIRQIVAGGRAVVSGGGAVFQVVEKWPYFYHFLVLSVLFVITFFSLRCYKEWRKGWLSSLIEQAMDQSKKKKGSKIGKKYRNYLETVHVSDLFPLIKKCVGFIGRIITYIKQNSLSDLEQIYLPSITSIIFLIGFVLVLSFFTKIDFPYSDLTSVIFWEILYNKAATIDQLNVLIAIISGLVAIIFSLVIFVAESIRDNRDQEQKRILLKESNLWFLVAFTILSLINFLWFKVSVLSIIFPLIIGLMTIWAFGRIILNLTSPEVFQESKRKLLRDRMHRIIRESIRERIGNNILFDMIGANKAIKVEYALSRQRMDNKAVDYIEAEQEGFLSDINFNEFRDLTDYLEQEANKLGFSTYREKYSGLHSKVVSSMPHNSSDTVENIPPKPIYLMKRFGGYLPADDSIFDRDNRAILALPKEFAKNRHIIKRVRQLLPLIFRFSTHEPISNIFRREVQNTKDQLIRAIKEESLGEIEELKMFYMQFAESFMEVMHRYGGGGYSAEQARAERSNLFAGWNELRWLTQDIHELLLVVSRMKNQRIIGEIGYLPVAMSVRAVQARDHLLFQELIKFSPFLYHLAQSQSDKSTKDFMVERSWRYLREMATYYIQPAIEDREGKYGAEDLKEFRDFAAHLYLTFQALLKDVFDHKDTTNFEIIAKEITQLYRHLRPSFVQPSIPYLQHAIEHTIGEERDMLSSQLSVRLKQENISEELRLLKRQLFFGLGAWIFEQYRIASSDEGMVDFYTVIQKYSPTDLQTLTSVFISARSFEAEEFWGWDNWEMKLDGEVHHIDFHSKLDRLYCVQALRLIRRQPNIEFPHSRDLATLAEDNGNLMKVLDDIAENVDSWNFVITSEDREQVESLKKLLKKAKETQEKEEAEKIKNAEISLQKIEEFHQKFLKGFYQNASLRKITGISESYTDLSGSSEVNNEVSMWGLNELNSKEAFVEDWHVSYPDLGGHYGQELANSENELVFRTLTEGLPEIRISTERQLVDQLEALLGEGTLKKPVIIGAFEHGFSENSLCQSNKFVGKKSNEAENLGYEKLETYIGYIKCKNTNVPVFQIFIRDPDLCKIICVLSFKDCGIWRQYPPIYSVEDKQYQSDIFQIRIRDLNRDDKFRDGLIAQNPDWLQEHEDKEGYLRQKIVINAYERFEFIIMNKNAGYSFVVADVDSTVDST